MAVKRPGDDDVRKRKKREDFVRLELGSTVTFGAYGLFIDRGLDAKT